MVNEIHPKIYQHAADKARELGRFSQADNLENGAANACGGEYDEFNKVKATPKSICYINGEYQCCLSADGMFSTRGNNYFSQKPTTHGHILNNVPKEMKTDPKLARKIVKWWSEYGNKEIPVLSDWHNFVNYNVMEKKQVKINEADLRKQIEEAIKKVLKEDFGAGMRAVGERFKNDVGGIFGKPAFGRDYYGGSYKNTFQDASKSSDYWKLGKELESGEVKDNPIVIMDKVKKFAEYGIISQDSCKKVLDLLKQGDYKEAGHELCYGTMSFYTGAEDSGDTDFEKRHKIRQMESVKLSESQLTKLVAESVKKVLKETELDYDMDNFSGRWNRGPRFDILVDGEVYYHDVPDESVDKLYSQLQRQGYDNVEVQEI